MIEYVEEIAKRRVLVTQLLHNPLRVVTWQHAARSMQPHHRSDQLQVLSTLLKAHHFRWWKDHLDSGAEEYAFLPRVMIESDVSGTGLMRVARVDCGAPLKQTNRLEETKILWRGAKPLDHRRWRSPARAGHWW